MRTLYTLIFLFLSLLPSLAQVRVRGYYRANGTYVQPHYRSRPDGIRSNNYSYPGNTNPYTGKTATGDPDTYLRNHGSASGSPRRSSEVIMSYEQSANDPRWATDVYTNAPIVLRYYDDRRMDFRTLTKGSVLKVEPDAPVRQKPDVSSSKIAITGKAVIFEEEANEDYIRISTNGVSGYLKKDWVSPDETRKYFDALAEPIKKAEVKRKDSTVNVNLNALLGKTVKVFLYSPIQKKPTEYAPVVDMAETMKVLLISRVNADYFLVGYKGRKGYLQKKWIDLL